MVELTLPILAHKPDTKLPLHRRILASAGVRSRDKAPLHLELAGPVRQLADADVHAALPQRLTEESPVTAPLSLASGNQHYATMMR